MSRSARLGVFWVGAAGLAALLAWGFSGLPEFGSFTGEYSRLVSNISVPERHATNVVAALTFDIRGIDTLGEEFILFAAAVGVLTLLRIQRDQDATPAEPRRRHPTTESRALRSVGAALVAPLLVIGIYIVSHGQLTPGGGFQGGVILMGAFLLAHLAGAGVGAPTGSPIERMELAEGVGAAGFGLVGFGGLVFASAYLENFLPFGTTGYPWSAGTIPIANLAVGLAVMGALLSITAELLDQRLLAGEEEEA